MWQCSVAVTLGLLTPVAVDKNVVDRAVEKGAKSLIALQKPDGSWQHKQAAGATALAALALLEAGIPADDASILAAVRLVRKSSLMESATYHLALDLILLDRLGDPADEELIASLAARLVVGQRAHGDWGYVCAVPNVEEVRHITEFKARPNAPPVKGEADKKAEVDKRPTDREVAEFRARIGRHIRDPDGGLKGDNSNTQFATLALWIARRHRLPVDGAILKMANHYRTTQNADGGWPYRYFLDRQEDKSTTSMTCAGLLGLAVSHGAALDNFAQYQLSVKADEKDEKKKESLKQPADPGKDMQIRYALGYLRQAFAKPGAGRGVEKNRRNAPPMNASGLYTFWSIERVGVAFGLDTIGTHDWYEWGAPQVLKMQGRDGSWAGDQPPASGVDTCFAILFLRRANFARDLTTYLRNRVRDQVMLQANGKVGEGAAPKVEAPDPMAAKPKPIPEAPQAPAPAVDDSPAGKLVAELLGFPSDKRAAKIDWLREQKGVDFTEALALAIPHLDDDLTAKAQEALAKRVARMKSETIGQYLEDDDVEIRRAAAAACVIKQCREHIPKLIGRLGDRAPAVVNVAKESLKNLTGQDFGPPPNADEDSRRRARADWLAWWKANGM